MIVLYRISPSREWREAAHRPASARWHTRGRDVLYTSESQALAVLEALAHLAEHPAPHYMTVIELPGRTSLTTVDMECPSRDWTRNRRTTRAIGDDWLESQRSALLRVPSVLAKDSRNVLLNPLHPDARLVRARDAGVFRFNPRLRRLALG